MAAVSSGQRGAHARVLIIGSGPAGLTAAIYAARADLAPLVIAGFVPGGQLMITSEVENYPGFPEGIDGPRADGATCAPRRSASAPASWTSTSNRSTSRSGPSRVTAGGTRYTADAVIIATGASAIWLDLPNETRLRGRGVSACATCDGFFFRDRRVAVVGGGDSALEEALFLTKFATEVVLIHRRDELRGSRIMQNRALAHPKIRIEWNSQVVDVLGEDRITALRLRDTQTGEEREMPIDGLFVAIGHRPNTDVFRGLAARRTRRATSWSRSTPGRGSRASSWPATCTITATGRRSRPPATAARRPSTRSAGWRTQARMQPAGRRASRQRPAIGRRPGRTRPSRELALNRRRAGADRGALT